MKIVMFYHSLLSDWNHGNAHFLRGIATELQERGHQVAVYEPRDAWRVRNLVAEHGTRPIRQFHAAYPTLRARRYEPRRLELDPVLQRLYLASERVERARNNPGRSAGRTTSNAKRRP